MTQSIHEGAVRDLASHDVAHQLRAARFIKNSVIGNKTKKDMYFRLGAVPCLVNILQSNLSPEATELHVQAAVALGSLAYGNDGHVKALIDAGAIPPLLVSLAARDNMTLVEAAARALKAIYKTPKSSKSDLFQGYHLRNLVTLLAPVNSSSLNSYACSSGPSNESPYIAELAASIIAKCCDTAEQQAAFGSTGVIPYLLRLLSSPHAKAQECALEALASLSRDNPMLGKAIINSRTELGENPVHIMISVIRDKSPTMRLAACSCLTNLYRAGVIAEHVNDITLIVLPTLVKLFNEVGVVKETAPLVLAYLVCNSEEMQKAACDADAIPKLAEMVALNDEDCENHEYLDRLKESALCAIAAVCSHKEECRKQVIEAKILPHIVTAMSHRSVGVRGAACQCTRSLSRSVKNLRTSLVDAGIAIPLFNLLNDESVSVQTTASATLCNIVLDFSPMKKTVLENGGVERLVGLVSSTDTNLRLNSVWALKNLLFQADSDIKKTVMRQLKYSQLLRLIEDPDIGIQEQALNLLRNLACGKEADIQEVFDGLGEHQLLQILDNKLRWLNEEIVLQTLYVIVNVATGSEYHKTTVMNSESILASVLTFMGHERPSIRVATVWCIINLTWNEERNKVTGTQDRIRRLRQLGFEDKLRSMSDDSDLDVRDRVTTALGNFNDIQQPMSG